MIRGEIWWARPSLVGGSRKRRPFVIVSNDVFHRNTAYPKVLAVHVTTALHEKGPFPWEVELPRGAAGLGYRSTIKCGEVYTLLKADLEEPCGALTREQLATVDGCLLLALGLPR